MHKWTGIQLHASSVYTQLYLALRLWNIWTIRTDLSGTNREMQFCRNILHGVELLTDKLWNTMETKMIIFLHIHIMTLRQKAGTAKPQETSIARQRFCKHFPVATDTNATIRELLEIMFSVRSVPKLCNHEWDQPTRSRFFVVFLSPRAVLSWYPNSTLHCLLHTQLFQW
jgi:hypothetical protein